MGIYTLDRFMNSPLHFMYSRIFLKCIRAVFLCFITILFVHLPTLFSLIMRLGKRNVREKNQNRLRAKRTNLLDPSSPYRALETLDQLQTQIDKKVSTLADIPDFCYRQYADRRTMGTRQVLDVEEEKQENGKVFTKVVTSLLNFNTLP